ncbi:MAG TPA: aminotransferase class I/II-fold pyridoxal phosphate-dependent enzyme [Candidatus Paceibacterota bacterium]
MQRSAFEILGREVRTKNISQRVQRIVTSPIKEMSILADEFCQETGEDAISFGQGVPYFDTAEYIKDSIREALQEKETARYTLEPGITELRELIANDLISRKGIGNINYKREIMVSTGCQEAMVCALATVINEGDEVLVLSPSFASYSEQILLLGGTPVFVPLDEEKGWHLNVQALRERLSAKTKAMLFSHPSNPTGTVFSEEELRQLAEIAKERDLILITDETYDFLVYDGKAYVSPASFSDIRDRVILCGSFSKKYALTGYRVGYAFAEAGIMDQMLKVHDSLAICAPAISQKAAIAALRGGQESVAEFAKKLGENRQLMCEKLDELSDFFEYQKPEGAYYILARYRKPQMASVELAVKILQEAKVVTIPGAAFGPAGEGHLRFSFACSPEEIVEGFRRLHSWTETLGK